MVFSTAKILDHGWTLTQYLLLLYFVLLQTHENAKDRDNIKCQIGYWFVAESRIPDNLFQNYIKNPSIFNSGITDSN